MMKFSQKQHDQAQMDGVTYRRINAAERITDNRARDGIISQAFIWALKNDQNKNKTTCSFLPHLPCLTRHSAFAFYLSPYRSSVDLRPRTSSLQSFVGLLFWKSHIVQRTGNIIAVVPG